METDVKSRGVMADTAIDAEESELVAVRDGIGRFYEIIKKIEADAPLADIREEYTGILNMLVKIAGGDRDVKLLARMYNVKTILDSAESTSDKKDLLVSEISRAEKMLQSKLNRTGAAGKAGDPAVLKGTVISPGSTLFESCLKSFSYISENEIQALKKHNLFDEDKFLDTDAAELAGIMGINTNMAFEIKGLVHESIKERAKKDISNRVVEMQKINEQLRKEIEAVTSANNAMFGHNRELKSSYDAVTKQHEKESERLRQLQNRVAGTQVESNRLGIEIDFLKEERRKLLDLVDEKHELLGDLMKRFNSIRNNYEFITGEAGFSEELIEHLEGLLNRAFTQRKSLTEMIMSSEESLEKLFSEFSEIVNKGKMSFYKVTQN